MLELNIYTTDKVPPNSEIKREETIETTGDKSGGAQSWVVFCFGLYPCREIPSGCD
jgi:hypothetical protein